MAGKFKQIGKKLVINFPLLFLLISTSINPTTSTSVSSSSSPSSLSSASLSSSSVSRSTSASSSSPDKSITSFITERTCWWNEPCKRQFQRVFRCKCPDWAYCRSPGKYFHAHCSASSVGYIWDQNVASEIEPELLLTSSQRRKTNSNSVASSNSVLKPADAQGIGVSLKNSEQTLSRTSASPIGRRRGRKKKAKIPKVENVETKNS